VLALGKDGKAYLLNRQDLGGIGGALVAQMISDGPIRTAPAVYSLGNSTFVAFQREGTDCPNRVDNANLTVLRIRAEPRPEIGTAWCGSVEGEGAPIVTTSNAEGANSIVWMVGAEGDNRLHGYRGDAGEELTKGPANPWRGSATSSRFRQPLLVSMSPPSPLPLAARRLVKRYAATFSTTRKRASPLIMRS
jgi:hypothetical protein